MVLILRWSYFRGGLIVRFYCIRTVYIRYRTKKVYVKYFFHIEITDLSRRDQVEEVL